MKELRITKLKEQAAAMVEHWFMGSCPTKVGAAPNASHVESESERGMPLFVTVGHDPLEAFKDARKRMKKSGNIERIPCGLAKVNGKWLLTMEAIDIGSLLALMTVCARGLGMIGIKMPAAVDRRDIARFFAEASVARFQIDSSPMQVTRVVEEPDGEGVAIAAQLDHEKLRELNEAAKEGAASHVRKVRPSSDDPSVN